MKNEPLTRTMEYSRHTPVAARNQLSPSGHRACPWWIGYLLLFPLRKLVENPDKIAGPLVRPGMTVLDPGCGMGYFSLPMARMVGPEGRVVCVDFEARMIAALEKRARKAGLEDRIETSVCTAGDLGIDPLRGKIDVVTAVHMIHEVPDPRRLITQFHDLLKPGGQLLILEPRGHVTDATFEAELEIAREAGFIEQPAPILRRDHAALLTR